jgi:circadian clock protein KaiB
VAGSSENSSVALANLNAICLRCLPGQHQIEVVDVLDEPQRAFADGIRMTPTLIKLEPTPYRRIVGTLAHTKRVLLALGLVDVTAHAESSDDADA